MSGETTNNTAYWKEDRRRWAITDGHGEMPNYISGVHTIDPWRIPRVCSNCGKYPLRGGLGDSSVGYPYVLSKYCPNCGKRMLKLREYEDLDSRYFCTTTKENAER